MAWRRPLFDERHRRYPHWMAAKKSRRQYITAVTLPEDWVVPLSAPQLNKANKHFADKWVGMWSDILWLAEEFAASQPGSVEATRAWHHLLMAVGNFKRSAGNIAPAPLPPPRNVQAPHQLTIPGLNGNVLDRGDPDTWRQLKEIPGLGQGVPTASTVLSALWPGNHVIIDRRVVASAIGLNWGGSAPAGSSLPHRTWTLYEKYRSVVLAAAKRTGRQPVEVERALYVLDARVMAGLKGSWSWRDYEATLNTVINGL